MTIQLRQAAVLGYLLLVLVLGGASAAGNAANAALQFGGAALIAWSIWSGTSDNAIQTGLRPVLIGLALLAFIQFIRLPPALWQILPGRSEIAKGYELAAMPLPWLPLSLKPWGSLQSLVWWIPPVAVLIAVYGKHAPSARHLIGLLAGVAYVSVAMAGVQAFSGSGYFYTITNRGNGVGFFSNSNHLGSFLLVAMALIAGQWLHDRPIGQLKRPGLAPHYALVALLGPLAIGIILSNSLAAMLLMIPLLSGIVLLARPQLRINWLLIALAGLLVSVGLVWLLASGLASNDLMAKSGTAGISRGEFIANGLKLLRQFAPFGTGLGTFADIYPWYEDSNLVGITYVNHAHNDLLELLIETGLFGLVVLSLFLRWFAGKAWALWNASRAEQPVALASTLAISAVMAHSLVDYPLRTAAMSSLIALCCILVTRPAEPRSGSAEMSAGAGKRETLMDI